MAAPAKPAPPPAKPSARPAPEPGRAGDEAEGESAAPAAGGRMKLLLIAAAALVVLGAGGGGAWYFLLRAAPPKAEAKEDPSKLPESVIKIGTLVVNVAGTEGRRYLRTTVELGTQPKEAKHMEELRAPLVDAAIGVLGTKDLAELLDPAKRDTLRGELRERLNRVIGGHGVSHVFLTEFVIQ